VLIAIYAPKAVAPLMAISALSAIIWLTANNAWAVPGATERAAGLLMSYGALSAFWAPTDSDSLWTAVSVALSLACGFALIRFFDAARSGYARYFETAIICGGILGYAWLIVDRTSHGAIANFLYGVLNRTLPTDAYRILFKPALTVSALYFWPWGYSVIRRIRYGACIVGALLVGLVILDSDTFALAIALGGIFGGIAYYWPRNGAKLLAAILISTAFFMPLIVKMIPNPTQPDNAALAPLSNSALHRLAIWHVAVEKISEAPIFGHGFDSARMQYQSDSSRLTTFLPGVEGRTYFVISEPIPLHPHNLFLQIWLELGIVGIALLSLVLAYLVTQLNRVLALGLNRFACFGLLGSAFAIQSISYGAWQSWWIAALLMTCGGMAAVITPHPKSDANSTTESSGK